jgi:pimeloyl-ACP methyl ester carboxylesterase
MDEPDPTIVLVHGAFADASSFRPLYDELVGEDLTITAPPNPLRGLTGGDGKYIEGVIGEIDGPVLLVGHSYGGSVITAAGGAENVVGLVYVSGFAPDEGENLTDLQSKFPAPGIIPYIVQHQLADGGPEFTLAPDGFHESFCADVPADDAAFYGISVSGGRRPTVRNVKPDWGQHAMRRVTNIGIALGSVVAASGFAASAASASQRYWSSPRRSTAY